MSRVVKIILALVIYLAAVFLSRYLILDRAQIASFSKSPVSQALNSALQTSSGGYLPVEGKDYSVSSIKYFEGKNWVVVTIKPIGTSSDPATLVFDTRGGAYHKVLGPSNFFQNSDLTALPTDVANYIRGGSR